MTQASEGPRFETDIRSLFREKDQGAMKFAFDLSSYDDVKEHAEGILSRLSSGTMPCDGPWPPERVAIFRGWVENGMPE